MVLVMKYDDPCSLYVCGKPPFLFQRVKLVDHKLIGQIQETVRLEHKIRYLHATTIALPRQLMDTC